MTCWDLSDLIVRPVGNANIFVQLSKLQGLGSGGVPKTGPGGKDVRGRFATGAWSGNMVAPGREDGRCPVVTADDDNGAAGNVIPSQRVTVVAVDPQAAALGGGPDRAHRHKTGSIVMP